MDRFLLLPLGAAIAIVWANTASESYFRFAHALAFPVNEIGMALFLGLIAQETFEAIMPGGALHTWRRWGLPVVAAAGGFAGAAVVYLGYVHLRHEQVLGQAWPIACAIDVAAGYYLLKLIYPRSPALPFLLVLALATNAAGLAVLAGRAPFTESQFQGVALFIAAIGFAALLWSGDVRTFWPYAVVSGTVSWIGLYLAGLHPALALVPIVPFLPHERRRLDLFADPPDDDAVHHVEHEWNEVAQGVLFLFGLVNAGVLLSGYDTGTWAVLVAALVGRPLGIVVAVGLGLLVGLRPPRGFGWRELILVALATSSGFTLALFFASGLLPVGAVLQQVKLGALATAAGAILVLGAARILRAGRFAR
jgi:NhaA family Na+:H+ antiporter